MNQLMFLNTSSRTKFHNKVDFTFNRKYHVFCKLFQRIVRDKTKGVVDFELDLS